MLEVGQKAPAFELPDSEGIIHSNKDYSGKLLLIYFYPKDFTSGCTKEACNFRDDFSKFGKSIMIIGVSKDKIDSHKKFIERYKLPFTLLSDVKGTMTKSYGTNGIVFAKRTSFLISPEGKIVKIYEKVNPKTHSAQILKDIGDLKS